MVDTPFTLSLKNLNSDHRSHKNKANSHRGPIGSGQHSHHRCKSQEKFIFEHNHFTHSRIVKASHDIPHEIPQHPEHKHHEDHSRVVTIKARQVSENILLDSFPPN